MPKKIVNIKGLAEMTGRDRSRISKLVNEDGRLVGDFIDNDNRQYWSIASARQIAETIKAHKESGKAGRGVKLELPKRRARRKPEER